MTVTDIGTLSQHDSDRRGVPGAITVNGMTTVPDTPHARLGQAMNEMGLNDSALADLVGAHRQQIHKLRHGLQRMTPQWANKLCKPLGVSATYLMAIDGVVTGSEHESRETTRRQADAAPTWDFVIEELDVRAKGGAGAAQPDLVTDGDESGHPVLARWRIPGSYMHANSANPSAVRIIRVSGDSMEPDYPANDRVMVDTSHRVPSPDGVYVLWDGYGLIIKRLELIYGSSPPRVRISSANPAYSSYEVAVSDVLINGRVVGKWTWK